MVQIDKLFAKKWPSTYALKGLVPLAVAIFACYLVAMGNKDLPNWLATSCLVIALLLLAVILINWFFEGLFPNLRVVPNVIRGLFRLIIKPYTWLIKLLIKSAVDEIVSQENQKAAVGKEQVFEGNKDLESDRVYSMQDIQRLKFSFKPEADYWRFGFRLSGYNSFPDGRLTPGVALLHFFKDDNSNSLKVIYYDHNNVANSESVLKENYHNERIEVHVDQKEGLRVVAKIGANEVYSEKYDFDSHKYLKLRAWSDHNWYYRIVTKF